MRDKINIGAKIFGAVSGKFYNLGLSVSKFGNSSLTKGSDLVRKWMKFDIYITGKNYNEDYNKKGELIMPRKKREWYQGAKLHVIARGNHRS